MKHLAPEELVDLAEGVRAEASAPHLASCAVCRQELADLRELLTRVDEVPVPEPSPLFWDQLSARVRDAVAVEGRPKPRGRDARQWWWGFATAASVGVAVLAAFVLFRADARPAGPVSSPAGAVGDRSSMAAAFSSVPLSDVAPLEEDPSLGLLGDLAAGLEWEAAADAGIGVGVGAADNAVGSLTPAERVELGRLLDEALAGRGV